MLATIQSGLINVLRAALYQLGVLGLYHRIRNAHTLTVLMFHRVLPSDSSAYKHADREFTFSADGFSACLDFIERHYQVVGLDRVIDAKNGGKPLPQRSALITFDDGWYDTIAYAYPQLENRGLPAVLFLATEVVELANNRWWQDALVELTNDPQKTSLLADSLGVEKVGMRALTAAVASMPAQTRFELLAKYVECSGFERQMLTRADLLAIDKGLLMVAAHGHTHAPLTEAVNPKHEMELSSVAVAALGGNSKAMSFPHGACDDTTISAAHNAGFEWIFSSKPVINSVASIHSSQVLGRIHVPENLWTCSNGMISAARLATFLFFRPHHG